MAEEKKWQKWEGPGEPEGKGGMSTAEQHEQVEGREHQLTITCLACGASGHIDREFKWFTCWRCGITYLNA